MRFYILIHLLLWSLAAMPQSGYYHFSKLTTGNGLSNNQVNAILQDREGFLWFGTASGLNRYDGYGFKTFRKKANDSSSLIENNVLGLYDLPDGKMWIKTRWLPCIYDFKTEKFNARCDSYLEMLGLPTGQVTAVIKGFGGRYWFLYNGRFAACYQDNGKKAMVFHPSPSGNISALKETADGKLWMIHDNGLLQQYDIATQKLIYTNTALQMPTKQPTDYFLFVDKDDDLWIGSFFNGVYLLNAKNNTLKAFNESSLPNKLSSNQVSQLVQDNNGLIWAGTDHGGVTIIDKANAGRTFFLQNNPNDPKSLSQNTVNTLYKDNNGIIWLGTYKQGINFLDANIVQFPHYYFQRANTKSLPYDDVNRFAEDKDGNLWIGTNGGGLIYFNRQTNTFKQYLHNPADNTSLSNNVVVSLCIDHEGTLWVGTYMGGLNRFNEGRFIHYRHSENDPYSLAADNVWEIFEDRDHRLWIGTLGGELALLNKKSGRFESFTPKGAAQRRVPLSYTSKIMQDAKGQVWVGTVFGVSVIKADTLIEEYFSEKGNKNSLSNNIVTDLLEDSQGRIWISTREGLNLLDRQANKTEVFTTADGLPDNIVLNILEDDQQAIWLSTPSGLCRAIPRSGPNGTELSIISYDETNNVPVYNFNEKAALKTRGGELLFGGSAGFNIINPKKITRAVVHPQIVFTELNVLNNRVGPGDTVNGRMILSQPLSQTQSIGLKYQENIFSIEFTSLGFIHSERDKYAYMLEGFNTGWLFASSSQRRVTYTNLDPGHYVFKVKVQNAAGSWSAEKALQIDILPPFWRTRLAYLLYALVAMGLFFLARKIILDRIHLRFEMQQQKNEAERAYALDQLKTRFFTNVSHELRTPLTLIISPLDKIIKQLPDEDQKKQLGLVHRNAKRLLGLVNQLLDFRKIEVQGMALHPSVGDIVAFVEDISHSFTDLAENKTIRLSFSSNISSLKVYFDKDKMEKILFNLLSNAFKYTHNHGAVSVRLEYTEPAEPETQGTIAIEVTDTGIGIPADKQERIFERFFQTDVPESMVNQGTGIGLAITKEFVRLHNGVIVVNSEPEKGTTFRVLIPAVKIREQAVSPPANPQTLLTPPQTNAEDATPEHVETQHGGRKKTILIVEDNEDLRFYLKDNLKADYLVHEATNGMEGWEKVKQVNPDLVVSDVMMPLMTGLELAKKLKTEVSTAHIPIVLLTAMGSEEKQLEGLKLGVNDYITKPFTFEILASRLRNLLAQQKLLQARFQKQIEVNPSEVTITPVDEKFLKQALTLVESHIDDPDFSVEDLSREMLMTRVTFYRKILSVTGKTPIEFIRTIRMKRAAQLLEKSGMSIAEVAYEVGFNNPKIFSKFFKEEFGVLPSQYGASKK